jgi:hypothetical protein
MNMLMVENIRENDRFTVIVAEISVGWIIYDNI